jgi:hypothetical protein
MLCCNEMAARVRCRCGRSFSKSRNRLAAVAIVAGKPG